MKNKSNLPEAGFGAIVKLAGNAKKLSSTGIKLDHYNKINGKVLTLASARKKIDALGKAAKYNLPKKQNKIYATPSHMMEDTYAADKAASKHAKVVYAARYGKVKTAPAKKAVVARAESATKKYNANQTKAKKKAVVGLALAGAAGIAAKKSSSKKPVSKPTKSTMSKAFPKLS